MPQATGPAAPSLASRLDGLLFFPVTACDKAGRLALEPFRQHVRDGVDGGGAAVFACCGTGEFNARQAGADGALVLPPYLARPGQAGLRRHYECISDSTDLDLIIYQRDNAIFEPGTVAQLAVRPNILGLKDGHGDLDLMQRIISEVRSQVGPGRLVYFNGLPTAEMSALAYGGIGVSLYSSAVYCFAPRIALAFHAALQAGDSATGTRLLDGFFRPPVALWQGGGRAAASSGHQHG